MLQHFLTEETLQIMATQDSMSIIKIGGYCGLTINAAQNEVLFNDFYIDVMDGALKAKLSPDYIMVPRT